LKAALHLSSLKIISGGQTGVDRAALDAALMEGWEAGGWCPQGRLAEDGRIPDRYPVCELPGGDYSARTMRNVLESDGTLIIYFGTLRGGTHFAAEQCKLERKPLLVIDAETTEPSGAAEAAEKFVRDHGIVILNVAGPRTSEEPRGYDYTLGAIRDLLRRLV
jgi:hypothetical protein